MLITHVLSSAFVKCELIKRKGKWQYPNKNMWQIDVPKIILIKWCDEN